MGLYCDSRADGYGLANGTPIYVNEGHPKWQEEVYKTDNKEEATMKDFLLIANTNACTYKEFFPLLKEGKVSMGVEMPKEYDMPDGATKKFGNICWLTTLRTPDKRKLILTKKYHKEDYPHYDNYNAIEVGRIKDIPYDYDCVMGVPITIFQYDLDNIEVMELHNSHGKDPEWNMLQINGKDKYARILIKKKDCDNGTFRKL